MEKDILKILITEEEIKARIQELGEELTREYAGKNPIFVGVLKGVVVFYADMVRAITVPCQFDFMWISSYEGTESRKMVVKRDVSADMEGRHVVILEDIFDTGNSLSFVYNHLLSKNPASLRICTLLDKPERRNPGVTLQADYTGFIVPNEFVVGYGLDYNEYYRNLPYVGVLKPEAYQSKGVPILKKGNLFTIFFYLGMIALGFWLVTAVFSAGNTIPYSQVLELFEDQQVKSFVVNGNELSLVLHEAYEGSTRYTVTLGDVQLFRQSL